ncbi:hypothetical protein [Lysobacter gummosus]|uniref:hypothetical protein n=1 Tax=Lysobacter gummosus TaxID=262324 RepID=UPI00362BF2B5
MTLENSPFASAHGQQHDGRPPYLVKLLPLANWPCHGRQRKAGLIPPSCISQVAL